MNDPVHNDWHRLFSAALNDTTTDEERRQLATLLKSSAEARQLWFLYHDNECGLAELQQSAATSHVMAETTHLSPQRQTTRWQQWRPLSAAAAGLAIGLFSASLVFGFVIQRGVDKKTPLAIFEPGFENAQMALVRGFPRGARQWGGDAAQVVAEENGVPPKEGQLMLRLEPAPKGAPRIYQVLDLRSLPTVTGADVREIEISASFATAVTESSVRYMIRAFGVTEATENLDAAWFDRRDESIASATRGLDVMPGAKGWETFSVRIQVPRAARSLVLFFGARTPDKDFRTSPHYLDAVRVSLVGPVALP